MKNQKPEYQLKLITLHKREKYTFDFDLCVFTTAHSFGFYLNLNNQLYRTISTKL